MQPKRPSLRSDSVLCLPSDVSPKTHIFDSWEISVQKHLFFPTNAAQLMYRAHHGMPKSAYGSDDGLTSQS